MLHSVIEEFGESLPQIKNVLIDERDEYMTGKLEMLATSESGTEKYPSCGRSGH